MKKVKEYKNPKPRQNGIKGTTKILAKNPLKEKPPVTEDKNGMTAN
jgi:hypothetical protein